jgi:hypothetical protein
VIEIMNRTKYCDKKISTVMRGIALKKRLFEENGNMARESKTQPSNNKDKSTPRQEKPSLHATREFNESIKRYLSQFTFGNSSLFVGPIELGTATVPCVKTPIEMNLDEVRYRLENVRTILLEAIRWAKESARLTREIMKDLNERLPEADQRIAGMQEIAGELEKALHEFQGVAWHPGCYEEIRRRINFIPGDPAIRVLVEVWI